MSSAEVGKNGPKFDVCLRPKFGEWPQFFIEGGICKSTTPPTYWQSLVEIPWLIFHLC